MFFRDEDKQKIPYTFGDDANGFVNKGMLKYLFTALIQPVILVNAFLRAFCPMILDKTIEVLGYLKFGKYLDFTILQVIVMNPIAQFMTLTCIILYLSCKYSEALYAAFISFLGDGKPPASVKWLYLIVAYDIIIGVTRRSSSIYGTMQSMSDRIEGFAKTLTSPIMSFVTWLLLVIFSFLNIRLAGLFIVVYLYISSYLAVGIYNGVNNKPSIAVAIGAMNTLFRKSVTNIGGRRCPPNPTFLEKLFVIIMELCYDCMAYVLYFAVLSYGIYKYVTELNSNSTKIILSSVNGGILFLIVIYIILRVRTKMMNPLDINDYDNI
jgi:hypothetical protein